MELATLPQMMQALIDEVQSAQATRHPTVKTDTDLLPKSAANDIRGAVDDEIRAIELVVDVVKVYAAKSLASLRRRRNQVAPINRLPHQLLSDTFYLAHFDHSTDCSAMADPWVHRFSTVSHLWRQIVEASPLLWTILHPHSGVVVDHLLARSRQAPLHVRLSILATDAEGAVEDFAARVTPHSHRWSTCQLYGLPELFEPLLQHPAPKLEELTLSCLKLASDQSSHLDFPIFAGVTSSLRFLSLDAVCVPLVSPIYLSLVQLRLSHMEFLESGDFPRLFDILESSSRLEELALRNIKFLLSSEVTVRKIELPRLRLLELSGGRPTYCILSRITTPVACELRLVLDREDSLESTIPQHSPSSPSFFRDVSNIEHLEIDLQEKGGHGSMGWDLGLMGKSNGPKGNGLSFQIRKNAANVGGLRLVLSAIGTIPLNLGVTAGLTNFFDCHPLLEHISFDNCGKELLKVFTITPTRLYVLCSKASDFTLVVGSMAQS
ncbi:hypothetical protein BOTBODRAFT_190755 [Botryobasidium botryosum FD-172 SS1]|uniref:F-box domain-containing protein n=1 Tax=Botryobasidium botryosum (strain FD-172 SS1) TaxID=930990 RepID=A0A067M5I4_BOTB1|nr:hypothetical protein BOTBODRAFT_190755 [Botryobasidium botryosum FD-172 SS1]